jgi:hypothetical protein
VDGGRCAGAAKGARSAGHRRCGQGDPGGPPSRSAEKGGAAAQQALASTAAVQQTLKLAGFWDGPVDGRWTQALTDALKRFQTELDVPATGTVDAATVAALEKTIAEAKKPPPSSPTPPPTRS